MHRNDLRKMGSLNFAKEYLEFRKVLLSRKEPARLLLCGSFYEMPLLYSLSNPTDLDNMFCDMTLCAVYGQTNVHARHKGSVLTIDSRDCHIGYVRLRNGKEYFTKKYHVNKGPADTKEITIDDACLRFLLGRINTRWRDICMITEDYVYAISCPQWPPDAHEWITRERLNGWPPKDTINVIVENGCHLVSKPHGKNPNDDTQWRYSFSQAETILIHNTWTDVQKYIYHLLRIIKRDVVMKCGGQDDTFVSTYYFKTLMLWACEEKPSKFWEERNIVASVRELLLNLVENIIERYVPHYFLPANNIMDDFPCSPNVDNEIYLLLCYREEEILELVRSEPKAYKMTPCFIFKSNDSLYPLVTTLSTNSKSTVASRYRHTQEPRTDLHNRCDTCMSNSCFYPELEYLHKGLMMHLELSKLKNNEDIKCRHDLITSADELFDLSIRKLDYGFTRIRFHLGWSVFELYQQLRVLCGDKHFQDSNPMCSRSWTPGTISTSCYLSDSDNYRRRLYSFSENRTETSRIVHVLQEIALIESPINPTFFLCSAYKANFLYNGLCDYRQALALCQEVGRLLNCSSLQQFTLWISDFIRFPLRSEWCGLYDKYIQIIFGFLTLYRSLLAPPTDKSRIITAYICPVLYLRYIHTRCCILANEPVIDFGFDFDPFCRHKSLIMHDWGRFSKAILRTALFISKPRLVNFCRRSIKMRN